MREAFGKMMSEDINGQPDALAAVFESFIHQARIFDRLSLLTWMKGGVVFTGCGTTYALALSAAALYRRQGFFAIGLPASEIHFHPDVLLPCAATLAAFSRSGESSETLWAVDTFRRERPLGKVIAITANPYSSLARAADLVLDAALARDRSVVETGSFTGMLYLAQSYSTWLVDNRVGLKYLASIPNHMKRLMPEAKKAAKCFGIDDSLTRFFFLGSGALYGVACQSALLMKESSAEWAEAFCPLEFRHGPRTSAVRGAFVGLFLAHSFPNRLTNEEWRVLKEMNDQGASTLVVLEKFTGSGIIKGANISSLELDTNLPDLERIVLYLPFLQWLAYFKALARGKDPDHPANLDAVTRL